jgi:hypothetical protein
VEHLQEDNLVRWQLLNLSFVSFRCSIRLRLFQVFTSSVSMETQTITSHMGNVSAEREKFACAIIHHPC